MHEIYVSTDIEADGPIPGPHSMLSLASAAFEGDTNLLGSFSVNLRPLPDATAHPKTMAWWRDHPDAWAACRQNPEEPEAAMARYAAWVKALPGKPVFVGYPAAYDFMFVNWYLMRFAGENPFGHHALDIKSFAMAHLRLDFHKTTKHSMPAHWFESLPHSHVALDDALEQRTLFCNLLRENRAC